MRTASTNKKVRELITLVRDGTLIPRPEFQRRLVWKIEDKNHFLDTVISGYPFPRFMSQMETLIWTLVKARNY
jgi:hypothetical protein